MWRSWRQPPRSDQQQVKRKGESISEKSMSEKGIINPPKILRIQEHISKIRFGSGGPAKLALMKIIINCSKCAIMDKVGRYPTEQREIFGVIYFSTDETGLNGTYHKRFLRSSSAFGPKRL